MSGAANISVRAAITAIRLLPERNRSAPIYYWWDLVVLICALVPFTFLLLMFDERLVAGESAWAKPLKLQLLLAMHFSTMALIAAHLSEAWRTCRLMHIVIITSIAVTGSVMLFFMAQAALQQSEPLQGFGEFLLILAGPMVIATAAVVAWAIARDKDALVGSAMRARIVAGLIGGGPITGVIANGWAMA